LILLALVSLSFCFFEHAHKQEKPLITEKFVYEMAFKSSFETYRYDEHPFKNYTRSQLKQLLGLSSLSLKDTSNYKKSNNTSLPTSFDWRDKSPNCVHPIRDQGQCGSCWAHAASEVLSDKFCIFTNGTTNVVLAPQDLVSCDWLDHGCNGGILTMSWTYLWSKGIVTEECYPYTSGDGSVDLCSPVLSSQSCKDTKVEYKKYFAKNFYWLSSIDEIKQSLYTSGPVESGFSVYDDFMNYKSGVYKKTSGASLLGGHAVKIIGWGTENGDDYWLVANSWNTSWGENGYFRIAHGECGIENCISGDPYIN